MKACSDLSVIVGRDFKSLDFSVNKFSHPI